MTANAERHEIALIMRAAIAERLDVMHERRRHEAPVRSAHLTQRFSCQMPVANLSPRASVPLMLSVAASESFVVPLHRLLVLFAVAALLVCEIRTACHAARAFRFSRHLAPPTKKPPTDFSLDGFFLFLLILSYQNQPSERNTNLCELMCSLVHFSVLFQNFFYIF